MDTLEELKYYCDEPQPVGALMLTGEWGCGKTYLLNNSLSNALSSLCELDEERTLECTGSNAE